MIQYSWDRREESKRVGVRLSWSLGDRRRRLGTVKLGNDIYVFNVKHYI